MSSQPSIGIDLGTTNSCIAVYNGKSAQLIPNQLGDLLTPSAVRILSNGDLIVGRLALQSAAIDPDNVVVGAKRLIGRRFHEIFDIAQMLPFQVRPGVDDVAMISAHGRSFFPQTISAAIIKCLIQSAESFLGERVRGAVITVPAYFNESQRQATCEACRIAGIEVMRVCEEPTAAALAYGLGLRGEKTICVFDLGGGTFDVSILEVADGVYRVIAVSGDGFLGGDDFDHVLINWALDQIAIDRGAPVELNEESLHQLRSTLVLAKHDLSFRQSTTIHVPHLKCRDGSLLSLRRELNRDDFNELSEELYSRMMAPCETALSDARLQPTNIDEVILVGGATRMFAISETIRNCFGKAPSKSVHPDEVVALGASIQAGVLTGCLQDTLLLDVEPKSFGVETASGKFIRVIGRNTTIPAERKIVCTTDQDNQSSVEIHILAGDDNSVTNNRSVGRLILDNLPAALQGLPQIEVKFDCDANRRFTITARDLGSGNNVSMELTSDTGLRAEEIALLRDNFASIRMS